MCALAAPAAGQGIRTVTEATEAIPIRTQVRHTTTVVLPVAETIVDVVSGDADYWDVSASAHVAYIKPMEEDVASNVTLVAESGRVWALLVEETASEEPDLVVYVAAEDEAATERARSRPPAFVPGRDLAALRADEEAALEELAAIEATAGAEVASVWVEHDAAWERWRNEYPARLRFPYVLEEEASASPWLVDGMWHDGRFTYLRSRAQETPALYELREVDLRFGRTGREPALVSYELFDDGLYVTDHVLGPGRLQIGDSEVEWTVGRPPRRWPWRLLWTAASSTGVVLVWRAVR